jgi:chromosome segregation ATPase
MTTLDELKEQVDDLRHVVRMADSDSVETRQLLRAQTKLMMALRQNQNAMIQEQKAIRIVLENQAEALGELVLSLNSVQDRASSLSRDFVGLRGQVAGLNGEFVGLKGQVAGLNGEFVGLQGEVAKTNKRLDKVERRLDGVEQGLGRMEQRQDRMDQRQDRMDRNLFAIMRHLGVEGTEEP